MTIIRMFKKVAKSNFFLAVKLVTSIVLSLQMRYEKKWE